MAYKQNTVFDIYDPALALKEELAVTWAAASDDHPQGVGMLEAQGFMPMGKDVAKRLNINPRYIKADGLVHVGGNVAMVMSLDDLNRRHEAKDGYAQSLRQRAAEDYTETQERLTHALAE